MLISFEALAPQASEKNDERNLKRFLEQLDRIVVGSKDAN